MGEHKLPYLLTYCGLWLNNTSYNKLPEQVNRKCPHRNTILQLSTSYNILSSHSNSPPLEP